MKAVTAVAVLSLASQALAFPAIAPEHAEKAAKIAALYKRQKNLNPAPGFDAAKQYIDVSGEHAFVAPGPNDQRGMCPGLNALANHGYLPHSGVASIQQFIDATTKVYGMGEDLAAFLAIYGAVFDGDLTGWSIGGPVKSGLPLNFLTQPRGLSGSHNKYDADSSPTRGDLYLYGNAVDPRLEQWEQLYALQDGKSNEEANYNLPVLTPFRHKRVLQSRATNPYFFNAPFSGLAVQPAAYTFIYRFMGNKSAEHPEGVLNKEVLKSFFAYSGEPGNWVWKKGGERIPENWYRRAFGDEYTIPGFAVDLLAAAIEYPIFAQVGGNTGKVNTFTGVDPSDLTGGVFNLQTLLEGNNLFCFALQVGVQQAPDFLFNTIANVGKAVGQINAALGNAIQGLGCPQLSKVNTGPLSQFPGYTELKPDGTY